MINKIAVLLLAGFLLGAICAAKDPPVVNDDTISDQVRVNLASDKVVGVLPFEVSVKQGVVTLSGTADTSGQRGRAEKLAKKVKGVKSVVNNITLKSAGGGKK
jgi:hyperosmotically inducible periplasmic protein